MPSKKTPAKSKAKKVTIKSLEGLKDQKAREPKVTGTGKKKSTVPSDTG